MRYKKAIVIHRTDLRGANKKDPALPQFKDEMVGECEIRGTLKAVWHHRMLIGGLSKKPMEGGYRIASAADLKAWRVPSLRAQRRPRFVPLDRGCYD